MPKLFGWVHEIVPGSPAERAGLQPGDLLESINGHLIRDFIDFTFYSSDDTLSLHIKRQDTVLQTVINKDAYEEFGAIFGEEPAPFIRECANKCVFCFIKGLPERKTPQRGLPLGMRDTLYIKDDDYRYSFMFGNFITLTNLTPKDWQRIEEQRLSPLYVSVHTTNPELRQKMVSGPRSGDIIAQLQRLGTFGIEAHTQLVLCPEMNDGDELERSIKDLADLRPIIQSISVVPVGLTKYNNLLRLPDLPVLRSFTTEEAHKIVKQAQKWQQIFAKESSHPFVYLSDEWYHITKTPIPPAKHYGGFEQIENGVGMTRYFINAWNRSRKKLPAELKDPVHLVFATSVMAFPMMEKIAKELLAIKNLTTDAFPVINQFWGEHVTVAGLLCGNDIADAILQYKDTHQQNSQNNIRTVFVVPRLALDNNGKRFLDDVTTEQFQKRINDQVVFTGQAEEILELVTALEQQILPDDPFIIGER